MKNILKLDNEFANLVLKFQKVIEASSHADLYAEASVLALGNATEPEVAESLNNGAIAHGEKADQELEILYGMLDELANKIPKNSTNPDKVAKIHHMLVLMYSQQVATEYAFFTRKNQFQILSTEDNLEDGHIVPNSSVRLRYLQVKNNTDGKEFDTVSENEASHIGVNIGSKEFNIKLSGDSAFLTEQANNAIHTIYGLQSSLGKGEAEKALLAVAEMHVYVRTMARNYRHENDGKQHPGISKEVMTDFDYIGRAIKKAHEQWVENGPNAAIATWNKEKEKLDNFNQVEKQKKFTWGVRKTIKLISGNEPSPFDGL